jgi:hypothetical protein
MLVIAASAERVGKRAVSELEIPQKRFVLPTYVQNGLVIYAVAAKYG